MSQGVELEILLRTKAALEVKCDYAQKLAAGIGGHEVQLREAVAIVRLEAAVYECAAAMLTGMREIRDAIEALAIVGVPVKEMRR